MTSPLRAVVADDSALYRAILARALACIDGVDIVAQAANGTEAIEFVKKHSPDFLTLDLNMPRLDGLGVLRALREAHLSCEVIVISSETRQGAVATLEALQLGAVDFITKPAEESSVVSAEVLGSQLRRQLAAIRLRRDRRQVRDLPKTSSAKVVAAQSMSLPLPAAPVVRLAPEVIVIGVSTGGPAALPLLLSGLPERIGVPIFIVQHMPPLFTASLAESLDKKCRLRVVEGHNGQLVANDTVFIAPGGRHMKLKRAFNDSLRLEITDAPPVNYCKPSVDVLFQSVAEHYGGHVIAAILTGMGNDGVVGRRILKGLGARVLAQDEATCAVFGMPQEAIRAAVVDDILPLNRIAEALVAALHPNGK